MKMSKLLNWMALSFSVLLPLWIRATSSADVPPCASMRTWFPGTLPLSFADNLPYQLSVTGDVPEGESVPVYRPDSSHTVILNGSIIANQNKTRTFVGFLLYAEYSVKNYTNGAFIEDKLPAGVEEVKCESLQVVQNSTSNGNWTSLKLVWKPPNSHLGGNITFRASVVESTDPLKYYEGFQAKLRYQCPKIACAPDMPCFRFEQDSFGCTTCKCAEGCPDVTCALACPNDNFQKDANGCKICKCADDDATADPTSGARRPAVKFDAIMVALGYLVCHSLVGKET